MSVNNDVPSTVIAPELKIAPPSPSSYPCRTSAATANHGVNGTRFRGVNGGVRLGRAKWVGRVSGPACDDAGQDVKPGVCTVVSVLFRGEDGVRHKATW